MINCANSTLVKFSFQKYYAIERLLISTGIIYIILLKLKNMEQVMQKQIKAKLIEYSSPSDIKATLSLATSFTIEIVAITLIWANLPIIGWVLHTFNQVRLFVQFHDMAHFSFFTSIKTNKIIGSLLGVYNHFPFNAWRDGHNHHHKYFGNLDRLDLSQTIFFTLEQYQKMSFIKRILVRIVREPIVFFFVTSPLVWFALLFVLIVKRYGVFSFQFAQKIVSIVIFTWICPLVGISPFFMWSSIYFTNILGTVLFHIQHAVNSPYRQRKDTWNSTTAALQGSTYLLVPTFLKIFTLGIEYHHIHHLSTNVPSYLIEECHTSIQNESKQGWEKYNINKVNLGLAFKSLFNVMLDQHNSVLVPFSYGF